MERFELRKWLECSGAKRLELMKGNIMRYLLTDGNNQDFIQLCGLLDDFLNEIAGGEANRSQYVQYNKLNNIKDVVLAYDGDVPVGCASFKFFEEGTAEVKRVFVKEAYRGQGISKQLMSTLESYAIYKGFRRLVLETGKALPVASKMYERIGYSIIDNYGPYINMKESICMGKDLQETDL